MTIFPLSQSGFSFHRSVPLTILAQSDSIDWLGTALIFAAIILGGCGIVCCWMLTKNKN